MRKKKDTGIDWNKVAQEVDVFCIFMDKFYKREEKRVKLKVLEGYTPTSQVKKDIMVYEEYLQMLLAESLGRVFNGKTKEGG